MLSKANRSLGILEGIQATLDDILDPNIEENTNRHVADVVNYFKTSQSAKTIKKVFGYLESNPIINIKKQVKNLNFLMGLKLLKQKI